MWSEDDEKLRKMETQTHVQKHLLFTSPLPPLSSSTSIDIPLEGGKEGAFSAYMSVCHDKHAVRDEGGEIKVCDTLMFTETHFLTNVTDVCGVLLFRHEKEGGERGREYIPTSISHKDIHRQEEEEDMCICTTLSSPSFVYTQTSQSLLQSLALSIRESYPMLLYGQPGSGICLFINFCFFFNISKNYIYFSIFNFI
jgi:hypothetical protein